MQLIQQTTQAIPAFPSVNGHYQGRPSRALRRRMRTPEKLTVAEWARKRDASGSTYRRVTGIDSDPGDWDESKLPHTVEIMETISLPYAREVYICMPERGGKTQILLNAGGNKVDQGSKSGNIFWLMPTEAEAKKAMAERIIPMLKAKDNLGRPGRLSRYLSKYDDDTKRGTIRFNHGIRLFPAWSNSPTSMASYFGALNIADEIDKFETATKEGSDALTLLRKRGRDDRSRSKLLAASTPGKQKKIYALAKEEAQQVKEYHLRCPDCDELIIPDETNLTIQDNATVAEVEENGSDISCPECGGIMDETARKQAYLSGRWVITKGAEIKRPETFGRHMTAFVLPMVPLKEIAVAYIKSRGTKLSDKVAFANGYKVCNYEPTKATEDYKDILGLCDDRPRDVVPGGTAALGLVVDTQQKGFYYEVSAMSYANEEGQITSHLVSHGYLLEFADLISLIERTWRSADGKEYKIPVGLIDSGGKRKAGMAPKHSRTKEVYEFCIKNPRFRPLKGRERTDTPVKYTNLTRWPGTNKPMPGGLQLIVLDVHYYKDDLAGRLQVNPEDPGAFVLYSGYTAKQIEQMKEPGFEDIPNGLTDYAKHLCSEYRDELGNWQHDRKAGRNDFRDTATYRMYLIDLFLQSGMLTKPRPHKAKTEKKQKTKQDYRRW